MSAGGDRDNVHDTGGGSSTTGRHDNIVDNTTSELSRRRTWSRTSRNLEHFPSFPRGNSNTRSTTNQSQPPPRSREEIYLSTHPSIWPGATFNTGGEGLPVFTRDTSGTYVHPEYASYSSGVGWPDNSPLWGLAKPLPRMVNESMRRRRQLDDEQSAKEDSFVEGSEKGDVEAAPWTRTLASLENVERQSLAAARVGKRRATQESFGAGSRDGARTTISSQQTDSMARESGVSQLAKPRSRDSQRPRPARHTTVTSTKDMVNVPSDVPEEDLNDGSQPEKQGEDQHREQDSASQDGEGDIEPQQVREEGRPDIKSDFATQWGYLRYRLKAPFAEYLATTVGLTIGFCGSFAQVTSPSTPATATSSLEASLAWAFGTMTAIYIGGGISGAHLNPAISITLSVFRGFPWSTCLVYITAQFLGALTAAGIAFALYHDAIMHLDGALLRSSTGIVFYTQPKSWVSPPTAFFNELVATTILGCAIIALGDDTNSPPGAGMHAFIIGLIVFVLDTAFSPNTSACLNPTRDLAPRIVASIVGYGREVWTDANWWWIWGPWCADITGCLLGAFCYDVLVFVGSESPVNYPKLRRKKVKVGLKVRWGRKMGRAATKVRGWEKEEKDLETGLQHHA